MQDRRVPNINERDVYDDLIEKRMNNLLKYIDEIRSYASGIFSPNDSQAINRLRCIRSF
jgi:hypothetical protein